MKTKNSVSVKSILFAFFVLNTLYLTDNTSTAQVTNSSPYSRYGIGDLSGKGFAQGFAMGGTNIAMQNDSTPMFFINTGNPASYSNIRLTTAELGENFNRTLLQSATAKKTINNASLAYLSLAFPVKKWWGASVGLIPYSSVGYKVSDHQDVTNVGGVDFLYEGSGGVNQVYFGNGIKPLFGLPGHFLRSKKYSRLKAEKNFSKANKILKRKKSWQSFSLGLNASYMFGNIDNSRRSIFPSNSSSFNTRAATITRIGDFYFDYGAQYSYTIDSLNGRDLKENVKLLMGATFAAQTNMTAKIDSLAYTYFNNSLGYEVVKDTINNVQGVKGEMQFPLSFGFGLGIKKGDKWLIAGDFAVQNWSTYKAFNKSQDLKNSMRVSLGAQYVPNSKANGKGNYFKRMNYRMGGRYAQTLLELKNTQLTEYGVSLGVGLPVGRNFLLQNFSLVNIGVEVGERGTTKNGLIKEQFVKATIGFTINDRWFVRPKFD
jgi:hypothetical protein